MIAMTNNDDFPMVIKSNDDFGDCHLAAPIIEKTARKMFQAVKRPRSWNGVRSAMYACAKKNIKIHRKNVCLRYMYTQKKCMPATKSI